MKINILIFLIFSTSCLSGSRSHSYKYSCAENFATFTSSSSNQGNFTKKYTYTLEVKDKAILIRSESDLRYVFIESQVKGFFILDNILDKNNSRLDSTNDIHSFFLKKADSRTVVILNEIHAKSDELSNYSIHLTCSEQIDIGSK